MSIKLTDTEKGILKRVLEDQDHTLQKYQYSEECQNKGDFINVLKVREALYKIKTKIISCQ